MVAETPDVGGPEQPARRTWPTERHLAGELASEASDRVRSYVPDAGDYQRNTDDD